MPICNLTVRGSHTFAVGPDALLVHNEGWCDILMRRMENGKEIYANLKKIADKNEVTVHGHHIVMKSYNRLMGMIPSTRSWYTKNAQKILTGAGINVLKTKKAARASKDLSNLTFALNSYGGIHSTAYAKAVYEKLQAAAPNGAGAIRSALAKMAEKLNQGDTFW